MRNKAMKWLLVEDSEIVQLSTQLMIQYAGYSVDVAEDGAKAIMLANTNEYALILMDLGLGATNDGYTVTRIIRKESTLNKNKPIIAFTAHSDQAILEDCLRAGMNALVTKPIISDQLQKIIDEYL